MWKWERCVLVVGWRAVAVKFKKLTLSNHSTCSHNSQTSPTLHTCKNPPLPTPKFLASFSTNPSPNPFFSSALPKMLAARWSATKKRWSGSGILKREKERLWPASCLAVVSLWSAPMQQKQLISFCFSLFRLLIRGLIGGFWFLEWDIGLESHRLNWSLDFGQQIVDVFFGQLNVN